MSRSAAIRAGAVTHREPAALASALIEATKPRITRLVVITAAVGFILAAPSRQWTVAGLLAGAIGCLIGTALAAGGANALNERWEWRRDARMPRTAARPLPEHRATPRQVLAAGLGLCIAGVGVLWTVCGPAPGAVALATIILYLLAYTPLKPVTPLATIVGAVPGALPPLIGWTAAAGDLGWRALSPADTGLGGWMLFTIMFVWQIPHFLAIAWVYRDDYEAGGFRALPVVDRTGARTARAIVVWTICLLAVTVAPIWFMGDLLGWAYLAVAAVGGVAFAALVVRLVGSRTRIAARRVFIGSIIHLPLLLVAMVADALVSVLN